LPHLLRKLEAKIDGFVHAIVDFFLHYARKKMYFIRRMRGRQTLAML
jgi:hypothetical protein